MTRAWWVVWCTGTATLGSLAAERWCQVFSDRAQPNRHDLTRAAYLNSWPPCANLYDPCLAPQIFRFKSAYQPKNETKAQLELRLQAAEKEMNRVMDRVSQELGALANQGLIPAGIDPSMVSGVHSLGCTCCTR